MAAALIEMQRNCAEGGLYVCREKGTILMQTLGVQIKHIYRGRTSPGVTRTGQGVTWVRQQRRGHAHGCSNEKYHSSTQNQIKSRNFSSTNLSCLIIIEESVCFGCGPVPASRCVREPPRTVP